MNTSQIAKNLLSDPQAYNEFIERMLIKHLDNNLNDKTYWSAWFEGAKGKALEDADKPQAEGLTKTQLLRRLVLLNQLAKAINDNLAEKGFADEDGFVNTNSVAEIDGDGDMGANIVNLFLLADPKNDYAEVNFKTDAEYEALNKPKVRVWEEIANGIEINEDFLPENSDFTYTILFDGVDQFKALLDQENFDRRLVGVEFAPKILFYKLDKLIEDLNSNEVKQILSYSGFDSECEVAISDIFMEKSFITFKGTRISIEIDTIDMTSFEGGETAEEFLSRGADIYLHGRGAEGFQDKDDLGGNYKIKFVE